MRTNMKQFIIPVFAFVFALTSLATRIEAVDNGTAGGSCCAAKATTVTASCPVAEDCPKAGTKDCPMVETKDCPMIKSRPITAQKVQAACPMAQKATITAGTCSTGKAVKTKSMQVKKKQPVQHKGAFYLVQR